MSTTDRPRPGGSWRVRWVDSKGERQSRAGFKTERQAKAYGNRREVEREDGLDRDVKLGRTRVGQWGPVYLGSLTRPSPKTMEGYQSLWRSRIEPRWGAWPLEAIRPLEVQQWVNDMLTEGLSHRTITGAYRLLRAMLDTAVENDYLTRNPVKALSLPKRGSATRESWADKAATLDQVAALADAAEPYGYRTMVWVAVASGLRMGELRALRPSHCHLKDVLPFPFIQVREAIRDVGGKPVWGPPKSHQARTVYLPPSISTVLNDHISLIPDPDGLVFTSPKGHVINHSNFREDVWLKVLEATGLRLRFHDLRHTCGSLLANAGVPLIEVRDHLGHATTAMTEQYVHTRPLLERTMVTSLRDWLEADVFKDYVAPEGPEEAKHGLG